MTYLLIYLFSDGLWEWVIHRVWEEEVEGRMRKEGGRLGKLGSRAL